MVRHKAQGTGHKAQGLRHKAHDTRHGAQGTIQGGLPSPNTVQYMEDCHLQASLRQELLALTSDSTDGLQWNDFILKSTVKSKQTNVFTHMGAYL